MTEWDFPLYADGLIHSFMEEVQDTANIHVDSQIKHFVKLQRDPTPVDDHFYFSEAEIPHILAHPHEWNSDFVATEQPSLHFIVFIPPKEFTPLTLGKDNAQAYIIPQTGGVFIYNREGNENESKLHVEDMHEIIEVFITQLRESFGFDSLEDITFLDEKSVEILPSPNGISLWERDQLIRERTFENLYLATTNLHSLSELVQKLTNMMISDEIQQIVIEAIDALKQVKVINQSYTLH